MFDNFQDIAYVDISITYASIQRLEILEAIERELSGHKDPIVLFQAGSLSVYWGILLKLRNPNVTILDMGLALGTCAPEAFSAIPHSWSSYRGEKIFESSRKISLAFSNKSEINVALYSSVARLSLEARKLGISDSNNSDLSPKLMDLEGSLRDLFSNEVKNQSVYSPLKYWLSEAYWKVGDKKRSSELLEESVSFPLQGFHYPYITRIRNAVHRNDCQNAIVILEECRDKLPRELDLVKSIKRISRSSGCLKLIESVEEWNRNQTKTNDRFAFANLPFWKSENLLSSKELVEQIVNYGNSS